MARRVAAPPPAVIRAITGLRGALARLHRSTVPANLAMMEIALGAWLTQALHAAVRLGIPDELRGGPRRAEEVARRVGSDPGATYRLMRLPASYSILKLRRDGRFTRPTWAVPCGATTPPSWPQWSRWSEVHHTGNIGAARCTPREPARPPSSRYGGCRASNTSTTTPSSRGSSTTP